MDKDWQDAYYDGDDLFAADETLYPLDEEDPRWYDGLIPTVTIVDEETWDWLIRLLDDPEEGDGSELE